MAGRGDARFAGRLLIQPDVQHLLLIGAYRDNEVNSSHPLTQKLDAIRNDGARVQEIVLAPLGPDDVDRLVSDSLRCERGAAGLLAQLVHEKTGGNPFFAIQFLRRWPKKGCFGSTGTRRLDLGLGSDSRQGLLRQRGGSDARESSDDCPTGRSPLSSSSPASETGPRSRR